MEGLPGGQPFFIPGLCGAPRQGYDAAVPDARNGEAALMQLIRPSWLSLLAVLLWGVTAGQAAAATCGGDFDRFLAAFRSEAAGKGISAGTLAALDGLTVNPQ